VVGGGPAAVWGRGRGGPRRAGNHGFRVPASDPRGNTDQLFGGATEAKKDLPVEQGEGAIMLNTPAPETVSHDSGFPVAKPDAFNPPKYDKLLAGLPMSISPDTRIMVEATTLAAIAEAVHATHMKLHEQLFTSDPCPQRVDQIRPAVAKQDAAHRAPPPPPAARAGFVSLVGGFPPVGARS